MYRAAGYNASPADHPPSRINGGLLPVEARNGTQAAAAFLNELARGTMTLEPTTTSDLARMAELVTQYDDLPLEASTRR